MGFGPLFYLSLGFEEVERLRCGFHRLRFRDYLESLVTHNNGLLQPKVIRNWRKVAYNYG